MDTIKKNGVWKLFPRPSNTTIIGLKLVVKVKRDINGSVSKYKARIVAKGYLQKKGLNLKKYLLQ